MFFAYMALRPAAAALLDPPKRLTLWVHVFSKFFPWVGLSIVILLATGFWMIFGFFGGMKNIGPHVHAMMTLGIIMILMFLHIIFAPFKRLKLAVEAEDWGTGAKKLNQIRVMISINLVLGLIVVIAGSAGRYL
jgi:uncharacterized membrane protein